jgi:hypothetical protein
MSKANKRKYKSSGCQKCETCGERTFLEEHHLRGRGIPNPHADSNLAMECGNCHTKIHRGVIIIEGWFNTTTGRELIWHYDGEESITGEICIPPLIKG